MMNWNILGLGDVLYDLFGGSNSQRMPPTATAQMSGALRLAIEDVERQRAALIEYQMKNYPGSSGYAGVTIDVECEVVEDEPERKLLTP